MNTSCVQIEINHSPSTIKFNINKITNISTSVDYYGGINVTSEYRGTKIQFSCGIVCSVGLNKDSHEVFRTSDGVFLLEDGQTFKVLRGNVVQE